MDLHFHDLRHTGNTWAAAGTSTTDLMARMGHDSECAALIYQHATSKAERAIAEALSKLAEERHSTESLDNNEDDGPAAVLPRTRTRTTREDQNPFTAKAQRTEEPPRT